MRAKLTQPARIFLIAMFGLFFWKDSYSQYTVTNAFPDISVFTEPLEMTSPNDGTNRLFVVEQKGLIHVIKKNGTANVKQVFLDIEAEVNDNPNEGGLLGLAFHPQYATNGYFFVNYTKSVNNQLHTCIARYTASTTNRDVAVPGSRKEFLLFPQPYDNHNGGTIRFGADGFLYISCGDGGSANDPMNNAQNLNTLLGKILRINIDVANGAIAYSIPSDNPFVSNTSARPEVYAYGLRNPWKMAFDPVTNLLWAGDVGQGHREEIDIIEKGKNYGWKITEGFNCRGGVNPCNKTGLAIPVADYQYNVDGNYSITGGHVYRGTTMPDLVGKYIFGDYVSGRIYALDYKPGIDTSYTQIFDATFRISSFGVDQQQNIYALGHNTGIIYKIDKAITTSLNDNNTELQRSSIYPNPVQNEFIVTLNLDEQQKAVIRLVTTDGKNQMNLLQEVLPKGKNVLTFDGSQLTQGIYFVEIETGTVKRTLKLIKE